MNRLLLVMLAASSAAPAQEAALKLIEQRCASCHGASIAQSGLRFDSREAVLHGGTRGAAIVAGKPSESLLIQAVRRTGTLQMPPGPKLPDDEIATLEKWIAADA